MGQFGSVCKATWSNEEGAKKVAVKTLKPTMLKEKKVKFLQEAAIMGQFFHSNVIRLFGVVTVGEPVSVCRLSHNSTTQSQGSTNQKKKKAQKAIYGRGVCFNGEH